MKKAKSWPYASPLFLKPEDRTTGMKSKLYFCIVVSGEIMKPQIIKKEC